MLNQYPLWKYLLILAVILAGGVYALPNLYGEDPALQILPLRGAVIDTTIQKKVEFTLKEKKLSYQLIEKVDRGLLIRFSDTETQLKAQDSIADDLGDDYVVALNLKPATPDWLTAINAAPMYLGLDLRGGVHFLMEVDMEAAARQAEERYVGDLRSLLQENKIRYLGISRGTEGIEVKFANDGERNDARQIIEKEFPALVLKEPDQDIAIKLHVSLGEQELRDEKKSALQQNVMTLRNRINELGVAEPVVQQQGEARILVQLPGIQDTARAKEILGATATLEFRMVDTNRDVEDAVSGRTPVGSRLYKKREGGYVLLKKSIIATGDQITDASSGIDQESGSPNVSISLDSKGGRKMNETTKENIGKPMAVVFIENKITTRIVDGEKIKSKKTIEEVINVATIRGQFGNRFQISGLDSTEEARTLALLLRAGALAAPIEIIEERTIGPSLGQDNIDQGFQSVIVGFVLVLIFMAVWYRIFGLVANLALALNLVMIVAVLSMLQATLTLPGIAGIVLTIGMAVDANVLIFERIREELRSGNTPQASISSGYDKAFSTIADANFTTFIAAVVLYAFGTGPIKGFAVTLSIGILTSMFTSIMGTRAVINLIYGGRKKIHLAI